MGPALSQALRAPVTHFEEKQEQLYCFNIYKREIQVTGRSQTFSAFNFLEESRLFLHYHRVIWAVYPAVFGCSASQNIMGDTA